MKTIIMCPPTYFDVEYELSTNRWMNKNNKPDKNLASRQWLKLFSACLNSGIKALLIPPQRGLSDMTFVANAGLPIPGNRGFILSHYFHRERRMENNFIRLFLKQFFDPRDMWHLLNGAYFEGQGDAVWLDEWRLLIGYGIRTNWAGVIEVRRILKKYDSRFKVIPLPMVSVRRIPAGEKIFYHLDTCLLYLPKANFFLFYPDAFLSKARQTLQELGTGFRVTKNESANFVCNGVVADKKTVFLPWVNPIIETKLSGLGYQVATFEMSEFLKSGGAVKCLILEL